MTLCVSTVSSPYQLRFCDSILSPRARGTAAAASCTTTSFAKSSDNGRSGISFNLVDLRKGNSLKLCGTRRKLPVLCFALNENAQTETEFIAAKNGGEGSAAESVDFADSLRKAVENENGGEWLSGSTLFAVVAYTLGITGMAVAAIYGRFVFQMEGDELPYLDMAAAGVLAAVCSVGMEHWARWVHKTFWHGPMWNIHVTHHRPRDGQFEMNDIFTIFNAIPPNVLLTYGLYCKGLVPGLCFGAGIGMTVGGIAYILVHDGLIDRRFPVGPIGNVPYLQKVVAAHQIHHADKFNGVPFGILLGPKELEDVDGGLEELENFLSRRRKTSKDSSERKMLV